VLEGRGGALLSNGVFWKDYFEAEFGPQVDALLRLVRDRLLPQFDEIDQEAAAAADSEWSRLQERPSAGDEDPADDAQAAFDVGLAAYGALQMARQATLNLFCVALHHAFEQQVSLYFRQEVSYLAKDGPRSPKSLDEVWGMLRVQGIDVGTFAASEKLKELRIVSNTIKHANGWSAKALFKLRPDLVVPPELVDVPCFQPKQAPSLNAPIAGEDIYIGVDDLETYRSAVRSFWSELGRELTLEDQSKT
jgi:hypothetical protein